MRCTEFRAPTGARLVAALRKIVNPNQRLTDAIAEYEDLVTFRNKLIHSGWVVNSPDSVNGFHAAIEKRDPRMSWYGISYSTLESMTARWRDLSQVADDLIGEAMGISPP